MYKTILFPLALSILTAACTVDATGETGPAIAEQTVEDNLRHAALLALASEATVTDDTLTLNDSAISVDDALVHFHSLEVARDMSSAVGHAEIIYPEGTVMVEFGGDRIGTLTFDSGHEGTLTLADDTGIQTFGGKDPVRLAIDFIASCEDIKVGRDGLTFFVDVSCQAVINGDVLGRVALDNLSINLIGLKAGGRIVAESADMKAELKFNGHQVEIKVGRDREKASLGAIALKLLGALL
ncbi:MAG: hypothetical protein AAGC55_25885 [Myxococcota bacterium]